MKLAFCLLITLLLTLPAISAEPAKAAPAFAVMRKVEDYAYYAGTGQVSHQGRQVEALNLPRAVLEKFHHQNAGRVFRLKAAWERK